MLYCLAFQTCFGPFWKKSFLRTFFAHRQYVGVDKGCEDLAAPCGGALRPGAGSHPGETPFLEGFLQVGMVVRGGFLPNSHMDGYGTAGDGRRLLRKGQF